MKRLRGILMVSTGLLAAACRDHSSGRADIVLINGAEVGTIDPARFAVQTEGRVIAALFEGLMRYDAAGRPEPGCALPPLISADRRTYTFTIRDTARWSDGSPVTAADFRDSWLRLLDPKISADYAFIFHCIRGAAEYNAGTLTDASRVGISIAADRTLVIELVNPVPYFTDLVALPPFCPVHMATIDSLKDEEKDRYWKPGTLVGNGPYVLKDWRLNDRIRLEKNPHYWDEKNVRLKTADMLSMTSPNTALNLFLTGGADLVLDKDLIPASIADRLLTKTWFHRKPFLGTWFVRFNVTRKPFDDPRVRRALTMAIDRPRITKDITRLGEQPAASMCPPGIGAGGYVSPAGQPFDAAEARRLLAEAGFPAGRGFPLITFLYPSDNPGDNGIAVELQSAWKHGLGLTVALQRQEKKVYFETLRTLGYDVCRSSWVGDYNDPNTFLDMFTSTNGNNQTGWKSAAYDALIAAAGAEPDTAKRNAALHEAESMLVGRECVVAPVYHYVGVQFYFPDKLGGIEANVIDEHPLRTMFWKSPPSHDHNP